MIEMLSKIDGDPDIVLWNGFVGDVVDINPELTGVELVKMSKAEHTKLLRYEMCRNHNDMDYVPDAGDLKVIKESYQKHYSRYELNEFVTPALIDSGAYVKKTNLCMQAKKMNKSTFDRLGTMEY